MESNLKNRITFLHILVITFVLLVVLIVMVAGGVRNKSSELKPNDAGAGQTVRSELAPFSEATQGASVSGELR